MNRLRNAVGLALLFALALSTVSNAAAPVPGEGNTDVVVMNTNPNPGDLSAQVVAQYLNQAGNVEATKSPAGGIPSLGSFEFKAADSGLGDGFNGSMVIAADRRLASVATTVYTNSSAEDGMTGAAYTGATAGATTIYIPSLFQRFQAQFSHLNVQNTDTETAQITIRYFNRDGTPASNPITDSIPPGAQRTYDFSQVGDKVPDFNDNLVDGWVGSAQITADKRITAVATTFWEHFAGAYSSASGGSTKLSCPWASRRYLNDVWVQSVAFIVQNLSATQTANVNVRWWNKADGSVAYQFTHQIPPLSAKGYNTRVRADTPDPDALFAALGNDWNGAVTIDSDQAVAAVADMQWRRQGEQANNTYLCENGIPESAQLTAGNAGATDIFFPLVARIVDGNNWQKWSSIIVQNLSPTTAATVTVRYLDPTGVLKHQFTDSIPAQSSHGYNTRFTADYPGGNAAQFHADLGHNFMGQVYVTSDQPIVGLGTTSYIGGVDSYNAYYEAE